MRAQRAVNGWVGTRGRGGDAKEEGEIERRLRAVKKKALQLSLLPKNPFSLSVCVCVDSAYFRKDRKGPLLIKKSSSRGRIRTDVFIHFFTNPFVLLASSTWDGCHLPMGLGWLM